MSNSNILTKLRDLHEELIGINSDLKPTDKVSEETIDALGQIVTDVSGLVDRANDILQSDEESTFSDELLDRITEFECQHPRVTRLLTQITDVVAMIGI